MLEHWLIELIGHVSGLSDAQLKQIEKSLPATKALVDLLNRAQPIIEQAQNLYTEAEPLIDEAKKEWETVGPAAQILIDVISHHVNRGSSPSQAAETVRAALNGSINSIAKDQLTDQRMSSATVFGGTGFVGRRVVRHLRESSTRVRIVSRHRRPGEDGGSDTFHSVHVETAAKIARAARQAGVRRFVHVSGIGANTTSPSPYIRSRGEGEAAVQTAFPGAAIVRPTVMFAADDAFLTTILRLLRSLPAYPIFGDGRTRLQPAYVDDVATAIVQILRQSQKPHPVYELAGPRIYSYEELLRTVARIAGLRPVLMRMPFAFWNALAGVAEMLPRPPLSRNQVELMQIDTTASERLPGFRALGISPRSLEDELEAMLRQNKPKVLSS
jgi:uncharacterized protein YbjT (DUF2867 family)